MQNIVVVVLRGSFYKCCSITATASAASAPYLGPSIGQFNFRAAVHKVVSIESYGKRLGDHAQHDQEKKMAFKLHVRP